jgi:hypothetical protein
VTQVGIAPAFASVGEAIEMAHAALGYLAAADAAQFAAETQAVCLRGLGQADAIATAARASFLSAFTAGQGYSADGDYSARAWLMHRTGITRGAAASHTAWANRAGTHPQVIAALAAGDLSESYGRTICRWTDRLPEKFREESDELLVKAAAAGLGLGTCRRCSPRCTSAPGLTCPTRTRPASSATGPSGWKPRSRARAS